MVSRADLDNCSRAKQWKLKGLLQWLSKGLFIFGSPIKLNNNITYRNLK